MSPGHVIFFVTRILKYENTGMSVDCIASYCSFPERKDEFARQFYFCLPQIDTPFDYFLIENISHQSLYY